MSSKVTSVIRGAACCGPRGSGAKRSGCCNAKAPGSSSPGHRQRPKSWMPCVTLRPRTWHRNGSALLRIASVSACRADPCDRPKHNSINCVRSGWRPKLQVQGDFCGIAPEPFLPKVGKNVIEEEGTLGFEDSLAGMRGRYIVEATAGNSSPRSYQPIIKRRCAREALPPSPLLPPCLTDLFFPSLGLDWTPNFPRRRLYTSPWVVPAVLRPARKCAPRRPPAH